MEVVRNGGCESGVEDCDEEEENGEIEREVAEDVGTVRRER